MFSLLWHLEVRIGWWWTAVRRENKKVTWEITIIWSSSWRRQPKNKKIGGGCLALEKGHEGLYSKGLCLLANCSGPKSDSILSPECGPGLINSPVGPGGKLVPLGFTIAWWSEVVPVCVLRLDLVLVMQLGMNIPLIEHQRYFQPRNCVWGWRWEKVGPYIDGGESTEWHSWKHLGWNMTRNTSEVSVF